MSSNSPTPQSNNNPSTDSRPNTPPQVPIERRRPGRPPKNLQTSSMGRGGGFSRRSQRIDVNPPTLQDTNAPDPSPSPPSSPTTTGIAQPTLPVQNSPPIVETVHSEDDTDNEIPDLVPDMFQNTPRNLSKTSFSQPNVAPNDTTTIGNTNNESYQGTTNINTNVDHLTDPKLLNMDNGKTKLTRLLNTFGFTVEPYTILLLDDIGAKDDHAIMDLTSWTHTTIYDILYNHRILTHQLPNPTTRFYYICNFLTTLQLIKLYYKNHLGHPLDADGLFDAKLGFDTLQLHLRPSMKTIENFIQKHDTTFLEVFNHIKDRLPSNESQSRTNTPPRTRLRPISLPTIPINNSKPSSDNLNNYRYNYTNQPLPQNNIPPEPVQFTNNTTNNSPQSVIALHSNQPIKTRSSYVPRGSNHQPLYNRPIPGTSDPKSPPHPNPYRDQHWEERGRRPPSPTRTYPKRHPLPTTVKWNGDDRTFTKFDTAISAWLLSAGMGYIDHPDFIQAYRDG